MGAFARRHLFLAGCLAIFVAGLGGGVWTYHRAEQRALAELTANALRCAVAFRGTDLQALTGTRADLENPAYAAIKARLVELRQAQSGVRFVYLFRPGAVPGRVVFLADSEPADSSEVSLPGDDFAEAPESPGLQSILATRHPATEGPLGDSFGRWVTGYAPIRSSTGATADIIGLDIDAGEWRSSLFEQGFRTALYCWLLLGLPLVSRAALRRWSAQERTIRKLSEAVEQSRSALMITGLDNRIEYVNRGVCEQLEYTRDELIGRLWTEFRTEDTPTEAIADLVTTVQSGRTWDGTWYNRRKAGAVYPVNCVVSPVTGRNGRILCYIAALRDLTEAKRMEGELRAAKERAQSGERAKGAFLDTMSHELRTPLNGIVGFTRLLLDTPLTSEQREYVQTVRASGEVLLQMTGDILDYSRMEANPQPLALQPCDVRVLLEEVLDLLACTAAAKQIVLLHQVGPEVPASAMLDAGRLRQVLLNLIGNALKFTAAGEVEVRVRSGTSVADAGPELEFAVRDTGPGIGEEDQKRLFQPFTQLDASINRRHGGAGLGLAISRSLVRIMGGDISLRSEPGRGAVFRFAVPAKAVEARVEGLVLAGRRVGLVVRAPGLLRELFRVISAAGGVPVACHLEELMAGVGMDLAVVDCDQGVLAQVLEEAVDLAGWPAGAVVGLVTSAHDGEDRRRLRQVFHTLMSKPLHHDALVATLAAASADAAQAAISGRQFDLRVLIVDDDPVSLRSLQGIVTALGCRSVAVSGGREAIDALAREERFDVVMLDLRMPDMDGVEVLRGVRAGIAGEAARDVWITIVTADMQADARDALSALGCDDCVCEPITLASCASALQRVQSDDGKRAR